MLMVWAQNIFIIENNLFTSTGLIRTYYYSFTIVRTYNPCNIKKKKNYLLILLPQCLSKVLKITTNFEDFSTLNLFLILE